MAYQPIFDCKVDVSLDDRADHRAMLASIFSRKMMMVGWVDEPGMEMPELTIRGTRAQLIAWIRGFYDPDNNLVDRHDMAEDDLWAAWHDAGMVKLVA